eukprot:evm.model.scf_392.6 EVM.evm.TU.scf_392.6   scf_392:26277-28462(+)
MDRDQARAFLQKATREAEAFLADLRQYDVDLENAGDWVASMKNFAPHVKGYHKGALESWQRFYLGLDAEAVTSGFSVMHIAQNKERATLKPAMPHSVYEEMKKKMRVGTHTSKLTATGCAAAREIMESRMNDTGSEILTRSTRTPETEEETEGDGQSRTPAGPSQARRGIPDPEGDLQAILDRRKQLYE